MRAMGLALLITLVAFAGCIGGGDDDDSTPTDTATGSATPTETATATETQTETDTGTSDPEPEENTVPTASLSASIQQGEVPVNVTFTLDGADADGDNLTWTFDADGDGTFEAEGTSADLPATYEHSYQDPGNHTATLTVSDGEDSATQTVTIDATAAAAEEGPVQSVQGTYISGPEQCAYLNVGPLGGTTSVTFDVDPATWGEAFLAVYTPTTPVVFLRVDFTNEAGDYLGVTDLPPDADPEATEFAGTVPDGAVNGSISSCGGGEVEVTYNAG